MERKIEKIETRFYRENGKQYRMTVRYGFYYIKGNKAADFAITCDVDMKARNGKWIEDGGGCLHDEISKHFPRLSHLIKWHLFDAYGPMHYQANALYWYEKIRGVSKWETKPYDPNPIDAFKSTIAYGVVEDDALQFDRLIQEPYNADALKKWLDARFDTFMSAFWSDMEKAGFNKADVVALNEE